MLGVLLLRDTIWLNIGRSGQQDISRVVVHVRGLPFPYLFSWQRVRTHLTQLGITFV